MSDGFVKSFEHLKNRPQADQALRLLKRIASLVKPVMRKHGWVLPLLAEFFPENPALLGLNINGGQKILIRLRPADAPASFYDENSLVRTMLHELTHNVHGPHDEKFYSFLSELEDEYDSLIRSGYDGEGFHTKGKRLGTNVSHDVPPYVARRKALEAAEKRRRVNVLLGSGGRLGAQRQVTTRASSGGTSPRPEIHSRLTALQAAEKRARDEMACATGEVAQREAVKAAKESVKNDVVDLTGNSNFESEVILMDSVSTSDMAANQGQSSRHSVDVRYPGSRQAARSRSRSRGNASRTPPPTPATADPSSLPLTSSAIPEGGETWTCPRCTLINDTLALQCTACMRMRAAATFTPNITEGWTCMTCGEMGNPHEFWSCKFCGAVKSES